MTKILEWREKLRGFYGKFDIYIKPAIRFAVAITAFLLINSEIGYMDRLNNPAISMVLALICTFLPINVTAVFGAVLILLHLYALSLEACVVALLLLLLMFFMYYKLAPKNGYSAILTPVLCHFQIPEVMPTALGLGREPYSALSMLCGLIFYYFLKGVQANEQMLVTAEEENMMAKFTLLLQSLVRNQELYVTALAFVLTVLLVYGIRRQSLNHAWTMAICFGNVFNLAVLLAGSFLVGNTDHILQRVLGTAAAFAVGFLMEFFLFHLDYTRTERVQFEDDEYYYYVKAVPKVYVSTTEKQVKQINKRKNTGINKKDLADEFDIDQDLLDD